MKTKSFLIACLAAIIFAACSQKQSAVNVPVSHINVENLLDSIDYDMDVSGLPTLACSCCPQGISHQGRLPERHLFHYHMVRLADVEVL